MEVGIEVADRSELLDLIGPPLQDTLGPRFGLNTTQIGRAIAAYRGYYHTYGPYENRVYDGIDDLLIELHASGTRLGVATAKPTRTAREILEYFGLSPVLSVITGAGLDGTRRDKATIIAGRSNDSTSPLGVRHGR